MRNDDTDLPIDYNRILKSLNDSSHFRQSQLVSRSEYALKLITRLIYKIYSGNLDFKTKLQYFSNYLYSMEVSDLDYIVIFSISEFHKYDNDTLDQILSCTHGRAKLLAQISVDLLKLARSTGVEIDFEPHDSLISQIDNEKHAEGNQKHDKKWSENSISKDPLTIEKILLRVVNHFIKLKANNINNENDEYLINTAFERLLDDHELIHHMNTVPDPFMPPNLPPYVPIIETRSAYRTRLKEEIASYIEYIEEYYSWFGFIDNPEFRKDEEYLSYLARKFSTGTSWEEVCFYFYQTHKMKRRASTAQSQSQHLAEFMGIRMPE